MPKFPEEDRKPLSRAPVKLRTPQARILAVLAYEDCPPLIKSALAEAAGFTAKSGTINSSLNGIPEGSSSGKPTLGLIEMGYVLRSPLDIDGIQEVVYSITEKGRGALAQWMSDNGGLPKMRDKKISTNRRYTDAVDQR